MSKFCLKCGNELSDDAKFCNVCGAPVENVEASNDSPGNSSQGSGMNADELMQKASETAQKTVKAVSDTANKVVDAIPEDIKDKVKGNNTLKIGILAGAAVVLLLFVCLFFGAISKSPKKVVKNYIKAMYTADVKKYTKTMHPEIVEYLEDEYGKDFEDSLEAILDTAEDEYGDHIKIKKFKVTSSKKLSKNKCEDYEDDLDDYYDIDAKVKAVYKVKGTFTIKGSDDDDDMKFVAYVIKTKGKYYVYDIDINED